MTLDEALITPEGKEFLKAIGMSANEVKFYYSFYQQSKQKQVAVVVAETDSQKQYLSASGVATPYLLPATFQASQKKAFESLNHFLGKVSQDDFLTRELQYKSVSDLNKAIMPVQKDAVALFIKNFRS